MISNNSFLHTFPTFVLDTYDVTSLDDCSLLSTLKLDAILLTFSVNTLCDSLLNRCCDLNIVGLFSKHFL